MTEADDIQKIEDLIERLFHAISWSICSPPDWETFALCCIPEAKLFPAARPVVPTDLQPFMEMMKAQYGGDLKDFDETVTGHHVRVFGNIAIAFSGYKQRINGGDQTRGVNGFLLLRANDNWKIAAMCWDGEKDTAQVPEGLR